MVEEANILKKKTGHGAAPAWAMYAVTALARAAAAGMNIPLDLGKNPRAPRYTGAGRPPMNARFTVGGGGGGRSKSVSPESAKNRPNCLELLCTGTGGNSRFRPSGPGSAMRRAANAAGQPVTRAILPELRNSETSNHNAVMAAERFNSRFYVPEPQVSGLDSRKYTPPIPDRRQKKEVLMADWLPAREQDLVDLSHKWQKILADTVLQTDFGWNSFECEDVLAKIEHFLDFRDSYEQNQTPENQIARDEYREIAKTAMREFANSSIRFNKHIDGQDKLPLGIKPHDGEPARHGLITEEVDIEIFIATVRQVGVRFWPKGYSNHAKPEHAYGVECAFATLDHAPASIDELIHRQNFPASPMILHFTEEERGSRVYCCFRWIGAAANTEGAWSEIVSAIVP